MKVYRSKKAARMINKTYDQLLAMWGVAAEEIDLVSVPFTVSEARGVPRNAIRRLAIKVSLLISLTD